MKKELIFYVVFLFVLIAVSFLISLAMWHILDGLPLSRIKIIVSGCLITPLVGSLMTIFILRRRLRKNGIKDTL
jgi:hypothetical protein